MEDPLKGMESEYKTTVQIYDKQWSVLVPLVSGDGGACQYQPLESTQVGKGEFPNDTKL